MSIDGLTFVAEVVNFLVLVALLKRFLYEPVTRAMAARESAIARRLEEAERARTAADREAEELARLRHEAAAAAENQLADARAAADAWKRDALRQAHAEIDARSARWRQALERQQDAFLQSLRKRAGTEMVALARRAFADLADAELERRMFGAFLDRLTKLDGADRDRLIEAAGGDEPILLQTSFPLPAADRAALAGAIQATLGVEREPDWRLESAILAGVVLRVGGQRIAWTLDDYLDDYAHSLGESIGQMSTPAPAAEVVAQVDRP